MLKKIRRYTLKTLFFALIAFCFLYSIASYWMGIKTQEVLEEQLDSLKTLPFIVIKSQAYDRGIFSSTQTVELEIDRTKLGNTLKLLPDFLQALSQHSIRYTNEISHGPLPQLHGIDSAHVLTVFEYAPETQKTLSAFFGNQTPLSIENAIGFGGKGQLTFIIPAFNYKETLAGVTLDWAGLNASINYTRHFNEYISDLTLPSLILSVKDKGGFSFNEAQFHTEKKRDASGLYVGKTQSQLANMTFNWQEKIAYNLKLNDLIEVMTQIKLGNFINPTGQILPSSLSVKNLTYQADSRISEGYLSGNGVLSFERFLYGSTPYGPFKIDVAIDHFDAQGLLTLSQSLENLVQEASNRNPNSAFMQTIKKQGWPILSHQPKISLNQLSLTTPNGLVDLSGQFTLDPLTETDLLNDTALLRKMAIQLKVNVPKLMIQNLVLAQIHATASIDSSAKDETDWTEIDKTFINMLDSLVSAWVHKGYIDQQGAQLKTQLKLNNGNLSVRDKVIKHWEQEDNIDELMGSAPITPITPITK
ncbi:MAG: YdgA family protein [Neisseriaceae bacterium]|nr:YdgA family protein [Neisseriaceae bacterium]